MTLALIADGILSSDWSSLVLAEDDNVMDYAEHGCSTDLSYPQAGRIRQACLRYLETEGPAAFRVLSDSLSD